MELSFELMLWRDSLAQSAVVPSGLDLIDWADLLRCHGETAAAGLLIDVAVIGRGFPQTKSVRLGDRGADSRSQHPTVRSTIELGVAGLAELAAAFSPSLAGPPWEGGAQAEGGNTLTARVDSGPGNIVEDARRLLAILAERAPPGSAASAEAERLLNQFAEADRRLPGFDYRALRHGSLDRLVVGIVLTTMIDFALGMRDLAFGPSGSIALLHRSAHLGRNSLGPFLSGVGRLVRGSRDLFDLAGGVAAAGSDAHEAWILLLTRGCGGSMILEIIDDLGDMGRARLLGAMLARAMSCTRAGIDPQIVTRIRDAALDNAEWRLAATAQGALVGLRPTIIAERELLGRILATDGSFVEAEAVYAELAMEEPKNLEWPAACYQMKRNDASGFKIVHGLESPPARQEMRLCRRGISPAHRPRKGERISAVDVS